MIRLFNSIETDFTHNGIQVLDDVVYGDTCILTNEINATYPLEMEVSIVDNDKWKDIDTEMFLKVPTSKGEQIFRIKEIVKGINSIKVYGKHVFFDLENNFILDTNIVQKDGRGAINQILGSMSNNMVNTYYGDSNISIVNNSRLVRKNVVSALIGSDDNSFINRWGGELEVDNFNFSIKERIGEDRDFQIRYRKNLTGFEGNTNTYNLCTRIVPIGYDGIMLEGTKWIDSQYINNYPQIYTYEIKFDNIKVKENVDDEEGYNTIEEARVALRKAAEDYFINSKCDLPTFSANVNFETLKYTEEYKDLNILERVELGDDVNIYIDKIDININARVIKTTYNFFTKKYKEISIGDVQPNLFKQIANLKNAIDLVTEQLGGNSWQDILDKALDEATKLMQEGLKDSYVISMKNQIVVGDAPNINDMINCIVINKNGIGFSNNGYLPDRLISAMTIDGKINASCINTGVLNAALIKTGLIQSINENLTINMDTGEVTFKKGLITSPNMDIDITNGNIETRTNGNKAISILGRNINFYDWQGTTRTEPVGKVFSGRKQTDDGQNEIAGLLIANELNAFLGISHAREDGLYYDYVLFDKNNINGLGSSYPIWVQENIIFNVNSMALRNKSTKKYIEMFLSNNNVFVTEISTSVAGEGYQIQSQSGSVLFAIKAGGNYPITLNTSTQIGGNLSVTGSKNSLQKTENYGERLINAYETAEYYYSDLGFGKLNENGECYISIDDILQECVNLDCKYHIFTQMYNGNINRIDRQREYFIVYGEPGTEFSWQYVAKRLGYENVRLDTPEIGTIEDITTFTDKDLETNTSEDILLKELDFKLEDILMEVE